MDGSSLLSSKVPICLIHVTLTSSFSFNFYICKSAMLSDKSVKKSQLYLISFPLEKKEKQPHQSILNKNSAETCTSDCCICSRTAQSTLNIAFFFFPVNYLLTFVEFYTQRNMQL